MVNREKFLDLDLDLGGKMSNVKIVQSISIYRASFKLIDCFLSYDVHRQTDRQLDRQTDCYTDYTDAQKDISTL